jgi:hypothetical protein
MILYFAAHEDDVNAVAFVDTPTHVVASGGDDGLCKIWDRRALRESHPVIKQNNPNLLSVINFFLMVCPIWLPMFSKFSNSTKFGIDRGMAFTPFPSSILDETRFEPL